MENILTSIINYLWAQSWQITALAVVIAAVSLLLKNKSAHIRYLLWLVLLAKCLVPPLLTVPLAVLPQEQIAQPFIETAVEISPVTINAVETTEYEPIVSPLAAPPVEPTILDKLSTLTSSQWLTSAWILGVIIFAFIAVIKALRVNRWLRRRRKPLATEFQADIENLFSDLNIRTFPKVWLVDGIGQPFVWGLLRGSIYLPADFAAIESKEHRRGILSHELSHVLRFDAAVNILQIIAQAVFWFHPFVWWANKKIRAEREKCCDEMVIARLGAKAADYSTAIVNVLIAEHASTHPIPSLAIAGPVKNIEDRIKTIMNPTKKFHNHPSILTAITILLLAAIAVPTTLALTSRPAKKSQKELSKFKKTLANGVTVELVGICEYPSAGKQWWRPDGSRLERKIITEDNSGYKSKYPGYEIAFKVHGQDYNFIRGSIKGSEQGSTLNVIEPEAISAYRVHIKPGMSKTKIRPGAAAGKWKTVASHSGYGTTFGKVKRKKILFSAATESKGGLVMTVSDDIGYKSATRLVAIDKNGHEHNGHIQPSLSVNEMRQQTFAFSNVLLKNIKKFAFQTRPYKYVTFKNVLLKPTFKPDVPVNNDMVRVYQVNRNVSDFPEAENEETQFSFSPVIERVVNDDNEKTNMLIDLDSGELITPPDELHKLNAAGQLDWFAEKGIDAGCETNEDVRGLFCVDMVAIPVSNNTWDTKSAESLYKDEILQQAKPGTLAFMGGKGELPITYKFKTREEGLGILQITSFSDELKGVKIRYKMIKKPDVPVEITKVEKSSPTAATEDKTRIMIDFMVAESFMDKKTDWETHVAIKNLMHGKVTLGDQPDFVNSILAKCSYMGGDKFETLIDLLVSRGYVKIIIKPSIEVYDGQSAKIATKDEKLSDEGEDIPQESSASITLSVTPEVQKDKKTIQMYIDLDLNTPEKQIKTGTKHTVLNKKYSVFPLGGMIIPTEQGQSVEAVLLMVKATILDDTSDIIKKPDVKVEGEGIEKGKTIVHGYVIDPNGEPIANATVQIREKRKPGQRGIAAPDVPTDANGYYSFDKIEWPYHVGVLWMKDLPNDKGQKHQYKRRNKFFEETQSIDFKFDHFPLGDSTLSGQVVNSKGEAVKDFTIDVRNKVDWKDYSEEHLHQYGYKIPFSSEEGAFEVQHLPAGEYTVMAIPENQVAYDFLKTHEVSLTEGKVEKIKIVIEKKKILYGRVLFEDGMPAVIKPSPWPGAKSSILLPMGPRARGIANIDDDGYFKVHLSASEYENIKAGKSQLVINIPTSQERRRETVGKFPFELLAEDPDKAGVMKVKRPENQKPTKPNMLVKAEPIEARSESAKKLKELSKALFIYANDNKEKYPDSLKDAEIYLRNKNDFQWYLENIEYLGWNQTTKGPPDMAIAYDKTLLKKDQGTNVLNNAGSVKFVKKKELRELCILTDIKTSVKIFTVPEDADEISTFLKNANNKAVNLKEDPNINAFILNDSETEEILELIQNTKGSEFLRTLTLRTDSGQQGEYLSVAEIATITGFIDADTPGKKAKEQIEYIKFGTKFKATAELQDNNNILLELYFEVSEPGGVKKRTHMGKPFNERIIRKIAIATGMYSISNGQTILLTVQQVADAGKTIQQKKSFLLLIKAEKM